jgi:calcium-dependent protein kinase
MSAISYLHSQEVSHRDLKPENLLFLSKGQNSPLKLIDFGLSSRFAKGKYNTMKEVVGTAFYMSPEVIQGTYDQRCDIWAAGVILYLMVSGTLPFNAETDAEVETLVKAM